MDKFTNREFKALTNEVMRVAREINDTSIYTCSISLAKEYICLTIQKEDNSVMGMIYFQKNRFCSTKDFKVLFNVGITLPKVHFGKYLNMISQSYVNIGKSEDYFEF